MYIRNKAIVISLYRLPQNTPARLVLSESLRPTKKTKGSPQTTYLSVLRNQLKDKT